MSSPSMSSLREGYRAVVLGASGAIGQAFVQALQADPRCAEVVALGRAWPDTSPQHLDFQHPDTLMRAAQALQEGGPVHLMVDATGVLSDAGVKPEKRLDDLDATALQHLMLINAVGPALWAKQAWPLMATGERVIWAKLSARVGSIEDNHKGGWYGYRASKAALNMFLQTMAIEVVRRRPLAVVAALQPGTVRSKLSAPFAHEGALEPEDAAHRLMRALDPLPAQGRAHFVDHAGLSIPW